MLLPVTTFAGSTSNMSDLDFTTTLRIISLLSPKTHLSIMEIPTSNVKGVIYDIAQGTTWSWASLIPSLATATTGMMPAGAFLSYPFGQLADYLKDKTYTFKTRRYEVEQSVMSLSIDPSYQIKKDAVILTLKLHFIGDTSQDNFQLYWTPSNNSYGFYLSLGSELESIDPITLGSALKPSQAINGSKIKIKNNDGAPTDGIFVNLTPVLSKNNTGQANTAKNDFTIRLPVKIEQKQGQKLYAQVQYATGDLGGSPGLVQAYSKALEIPFDTATASITDAEFNALEGGVIAQANSQETTNGQLAGDLKCTFSEWYIADCIGQLFLYVLIPISSFVVFLAGKLMDIMLSMSISSSVYRDISFILEGWRIVRDLCNLLFIFILIYVSISMILGGGGGEGGSNPKKMIAQLVLIAVVINFSLFLTRIVIDSGNILAHVFYNQISICGNGGVATAGITSNTSDCKVENYTQADGTETIIPETKSLSLGLMKGINPQQILSLEMVQKMRTTQASPSISVIILGLMLCALMIGMAVIFFKMAGYFIGRIAGLWLLIIGAPLAFLSTIIPSLNVDMFSWKRWFGGLITLSMMPALFLFFIYITFLMINPPSGASILKGMVGNPNMNAMESLVLMALAFALIYGLLSKGADISKKMAGEAGSIVANLAQGALSFAVGAGLALATGGAALAGRKVLGQAAMNTLAQHGDTLRNAAAGKAEDINKLKASTKFGREFRGLNDAQSKAKALEIATRLQNKAERSYDFRNTGVGNMLAKASGINLNPTGQIGALFGGDNTKTGKFFNAFDANTTLGGAQSERDRRVAKEQEIIKKLGHDKNEEHRLTEEKNNLISQKRAALLVNDESEIKRIKNLIEAKEEEIETIKKDRARSYIAWTKNHAAGKKRETEEATDPVTNRTYLRIREGGAEADGGHWEESGLISDAIQDTGKSLKSALYGWKDVLSSGLKAGLTGAVAGSIIPGVGTVTGFLAGAGAQTIVGTAKELEKIGGGVLRGLQWTLDHNILARDSDHRDGHHPPDRVARGHDDLQATTIEQGKRFLAGRARNIIGTTQSFNLSADIQDSHYHGGHFSKKYKGPNGSFLDIFAGLGGGGHGGGHDHHDDHGHDDHGGGHH